MSGFSNSVVGGSGILKRKAIQSIIYVLGVSGWTINADGSSEFNNLTVRGSFFGLRFIINSNGVFIYSGTPALGNLVGSWAAAAGSDQFTNAYQKDFAVYVGTGYININSSGGLGGNTAVLFKPGLTTHVTLNPQTYAGSNNSGAVNEQEFLALTSGTANNNDDTQLQLISKSSDGVSPSVLNFLMGGSVLSQLFKTQWNIGVAISATLGTPTVPTVITTDSWHAITLDANWSTLAGQPVPAYRLGIENRVHLTGAAQFNVNINNTNLNGASPLPLGYRPSKAPFIAGAPGSAGINILTNGVIVAAQGSAATPFCNFCGSYPLDPI
jgi:hypothetical protein